MWPAGNYRAASRWTGHESDTDAGHVGRLPTPQSDWPTRLGKASCDRGHWLEAPRDCRCHHDCRGVHHPGRAVVSHACRFGAGCRRPRVHAVTGLEPVLRGSISISLFPSGTVSFHNVLLGNDPNGQPAVVADELIAHLRYFPLLAGRIEIADVTLVRPTISVTFLPDGESNWSGLIQSLAHALDPIPAAPPRSRRSASTRAPSSSTMSMAGRTSPTGSRAWSFSSPGRRSPAASAPTATSSGMTSRSRRASR